MSDALLHLADFLRGLSLAEAILLFLAENVAIFIFAVVIGEVMVRAYRHRRVTHAPGQTVAIELALSISTLLLNTAITVAGWLMWREGIITFRTDHGLRAWLLDPIILIVVMDLAMYLLHRVAHIAGLYPLLHRTHHRFDRPHPLTLFVLNPAEALSFGSLWLVVVAVYDCSWIGMSIYLGLNVLFGVVGHLGVEPLPDRWTRLPVLRWLSTSTFHAQHHEDREHNFGFYTLVWDRMFGTLSPEYASRFGRLGVGTPPPAPNPTPSSPR